MLPKRSVDVRNVEVSRLLKLSDSSVTPVSLTLPRAENLKSYFQDDLFKPTRGRSAMLSSYDYMHHAPFDMSTMLESLKPHDMIPLSEKPEEVKQKPKTTKFREQIDKVEEENKQREAEFKRLQDLALQRAKFHPNASGGGHGFKVDAAPVHDANDSDDDGWDD